MQTEMHYVAILANVDSSFLKLQLPGFEIKAVDPDDMLHLVMTLTEEPDSAAAMKLYHAYPCYNYDDKCFFTISRAYTDDLKTNEHGGVSRWGSGSLEQAKLLEEVVRPFIELLRLYAEGNLGIPLEFQYYVDERGAHPFSAGTSLRTRARSVYKVDANCLEQLTRFLCETNLPFADPTLELARQYYDMSYEALGLGMRLITLMTGMEVLFNRGRDQIRYTVSRYVAVLLGENEQESLRIFQAMKKHYDLRSEIVHTGKTGNASDDIVLELRGLLRDCIKALYRLNIRKDDYCCKLDALGFGNKPIPQ